MVYSPKIRTNIIIIICCILLFLSLIRTVYNKDSVSLVSFVDFLQTAPNIAFSSFVDFTITADWGVFNFLRSFLNIFTGALSVLIFIGASIVQVIIYLMWIIGYIFV